MSTPQLWPEDDQTLYWIFTPPQGATWGLTFESFQQALHTREPEAFVKVQGQEDWDRQATGTPTPLGTALDFGITLAGDVVEGVVKTRSEGAAIDDATAAQAAEFTEWLRSTIIPTGGVITCNTRAGLEAGLPDLHLTGLRNEDLLQALRQHVHEVM